MHFRIERLADHDPQLANRLRDYCYKINGCCQQVHSELGPFLNEYIYQDALNITLEEHQLLPFIKEYYFTVEYQGQPLPHKHFVDFFVMNNVFIECKSVEKLCAEHRQQLWNYMRLAKVKVGILWNFGPIVYQGEHYYLDTATNIMYLF